VSHRCQCLLALESLNKKYPRTLVLTRLGLTVEEFDRALTLARIPLLLYLSLVVVVVLMFRTPGVGRAGAVGLALIVAIFRLRETVFVDELNLMKW